MLLVTAHEAADILGVIANGARGVTALASAFRRSVGPSRPGSRYRSGRSIRGTRHGNATVHRPELATGVPHALSGEVPGDGVSSGAGHLPYMDNSEEQGDAEAVCVAGAEWTLWDYEDANGLTHQARVPSAG